MRAARIILSDDDSPLEAVVSELSGLHEHLKARGCQDFTAAVLLTGMTRLDRKAEAAGLLGRYLETERRERLPVPPSLARSALALGVRIPDATLPKAIPAPHRPN